MSFVRFTLRTQGVAGLYAVGALPTLMLLEDH